MSRIGKLPVAIVSGVTVTVAGNTVSVKGTKGELSFDFPAGISAKVEDGSVIIERTGEEKQVRAFHGLSRAMVANMVEGVSTGFEKRLEIIGVGYRASTSGKKIDLTLGFSHPVSLTAPEGVNVKMSDDKNEKNTIIVTGCDKQAVGEFAANIRKLRKPEPYKGKGIRYVGEYVRRKAGKSASS
jgi:large subunit ribosomal protein L6